MRALTTMKRRISTKTSPMNLLLTLTTVAASLISNPACVDAVRNFAPELEGSGQGAEKTFPGVKNLEILSPGITLYARQRLAF